MNEVRALTAEHESGWCVTTQGSSHVFDLREGLLALVLDVVAVEGSDPGDQPGGRGQGRDDGR